MAGVASFGSFLLVAIVAALLLPASYGSQSNCPPTDPGHGGGGGDSGYNPPYHGKPPKHHHKPPKHHGGHKCPPCHPPPTPPYARPTPPYKPPTPPYVPPPYVPPYKPPTPPHKPPPYTPPYKPPTPPYKPPTPPYKPPTPPHKPPPYTPPYVPPSPPYTPPYVPPYTPPYTPPYGPPPYVPPPHGGKSCPIDALKLNACVDVLGGLVHAVIGKEARSKCCPLVQGIADLDAALCLCTTIRARVLNIDLYLPVALRLLITCGKHPPNGFNCANVIDA